MVTTPRIWVLLLLLLTSAFGQGGHSNTLTWAWAQGTGDAATGFHIWKAATTGGYGATPYATVTGAATLSYTDTAVVAGQTNFYVVTSFNTGGDSARSNEVQCVTPFQAPTPPTSLSGTVK